MKELVTEDFTPPAWFRRPELNVFSQFYLDSFNDLNSRRQSGVSMNPLAFVEIKAYFEAFELTDFEVFFNNIKAADEVFMAWVAKAKK